MTFEKCEIKGWEKSEKRWTFWKGWNVEMLWWKEIGWKRMKLWMKMWMKKWNACWWLDGWRNDDVDTERNDGMIDSLMMTVIEFWRDEKEKWKDCLVDKKVKKFGVFERFFFNLVGLVKEKEGKTP